MNRNVITRSAVPEPPYPSALVCIPTAAVPFTLGALVIKSQKYWYVSPDDWHRGRKLLALLGASMLTDCTQPIVDAIDRVYNLLDASLNGIERSVAGAGTTADPYVYTPPLEQVASPSNFHNPSLRFDTEAARWLSENLVNGTTSDYAPGVAVPNGHLQAIYDELLAMNAEEQVSPEQIAQIISILGAV